MHLRDKMKMFSFLALFAIAGILAQENASADLSNSLIECYNNSLILERDNRLPNNIHTLIAILRKIENLPGLNMDLRTLSTAILHRFRQDGIERNPNVVAQVGVIPFAPLGHSFHRHVATLQLIPGSAVNFPNASLTIAERCTLHYMISSTIERLERGDEGTVCQSISQTAQYREKRDANYEITTGGITDDAETLSPEEFWGAVAAGPLLAGIAAALEPQTTALRDMLSAQAVSEGYASGSAIHNRWLATIAGDLAEVALMQGPLQRSTTNIGVTGAFNATTQPKWYFLTSTDDLQMTTAEIRGDLDGLILADSVQRWYSAVRSLRLSQILDAYYSSQGVFNASMRACNRRTHFTTVAALSTMADQAFSAALRLSVTKLAGARISAEIIQNYTVHATNALSSFIPTSLNNDLTCTETDLSAGLNRATTHLTILLDTFWPYDSVQPIITAVLEGIEVGMYNSNFTIINGQNGSILINCTNSLLDFYTFNSTQYNNLPKGFDLPRSLDTVRRLQTDRLNEEQIRNTGGSSSEVVLILFYSSTISDSDRSYCAEQLRLMRLELPDTSFLYVSFGSRDIWSSLAVDLSSDTISVTTLGSTNLRRTSAPIISRIKEFPKRLINSACGASFSSSGNSGSFDDYVEPSGINYYRMHPNYFDYNTATINVLGAGWGTLNVCHSRSIIQPNSSMSGDVSCTTVTSNTHTIEFSCGDTSLISDCSPLYLSVQADPSNSIVYQCTDATVCRYPNMRKYTISYGNLVCRSNANTLKLYPIILIALIVFNFFH
ncbi:uncharacterized protein LOC105684119 isoform X2 [Athalia rosae]|uniref:uncharacterized protein LOC105684119 isoform X2 n=1 Tax=Athalia rosae TaxID=37344 RepID=UPI0020339548|nr:uncharacterized protein LOC105684119 isoform X2 [Athalia rosae]